MSEHKQNERERRDHGGGQRLWTISHTPYNPAKSILDPKVSPSLVNWCVGELIARCHLQDLACSVSPVIASAVPYARAHSAVLSKIKFNDRPGLASHGHLREELTLSLTLGEKSSPCSYLRLFACSSWSRALRQIEAWAGESLMLLRAAWCALIRWSSLRRV